MAAIVLRNSSRRLLRAYFSKLGWQANVIWRIAFSYQLQVYLSQLLRFDLFRGSLAPEREEQRDGSFGSHLFCGEMLSVSMPAHRPKFSILPNSRQCARNQMHRRGGRSSSAPFRRNAL